MNVIVHKIKLRSGVTPERFEAWVRNTDYASCPELPSVIAFDVHRVSADRDAAFQYLEVVRVRSLSAFQRDMAGAVFQGLVSDFIQLAEVVDESSGETLEPGYRAPAPPGAAA